jgi:hypothetical protein
MSPDLKTTGPKTTSPSYSWSRYTQLRLVSEIVTRRKAEKGFRSWILFYHEKKISTAAKCDSEAMLSEKATVFSKQMVVNHRGVLVCGWDKYGDFVCK